MSADNANPLSQPPPTLAVPVTAVPVPAISSLPPKLDPTAILGGKSGYSNRYVDLGDSHPSWSLWSNDPEKMQLEGYFSADAGTFETPQKDLRPFRLAPIMTD